VGRQVVSLLGCLGGGGPLHQPGLELGDRLLLHLLAHRLGLGGELLLKAIALLAQSLILG
jgi:hypothetical protein